MNVAIIFSIVIVLGLAGIGAVFLINKVKNHFSKKRGGDQLTEQFKTDEKNSKIMVLEHEPVDQVSSEEATNKVVSMKLEKSPIGETEQLDDSEDDFKRNESPVFQPLKEVIEQARVEMNQKIFGMENMLDNFFIALFSSGHVLCEGLPGLAKTAFAKNFSDIINTQFKRCQFSPDLLPSDLIGDRIFNQRDNCFEFQAGPIFTHILLADEINRSPAKTQAALLEVMQESQATVFGERYLIGSVGGDDTIQNQRIFFTIATQNPIEQEGTYRLPEAQLDRFMFRLFFEYPDRDDEIAILSLDDGNTPRNINPCFSAIEITEWRNRIAKEVKVPNHIKAMLVDLVRKTRQHPWVAVGAGPRACQMLSRGIKASAALHGYDVATWAEVESLAFGILNHRIILKPEIIFERPDQHPDEIKREVIGSILQETGNKTT